MNKIDDSTLKRSAETSGATTSTILTFQDLLTELLDYQCRRSFFVLSTIAGDSSQKVLLEMVRSDGVSVYFQVNGNSMELYDWDSSGDSDG